MFLHFPAGSIRKIPYPELNFPPYDKLHGSSGTPGDGKGPEFMNLTSQRSSSSTDSAPTSQASHVFAGCPQADVLVSRPPFDLMVFVSPEYNVPLIKAMIEWVSIM